MNPLWKLALCKDPTVRGLLPSSDNNQITQPIVPRNGDAASTEMPVTRELKRDCGGVKEDLKTVTAQLDELFPELVKLIAQADDVQKALRGGGTNKQLFV